LNGNTKTRNHQKTLRKTQKNLPISKEYLPERKLGRGPVFTISLTGGGFAPLPPVSYATDQVQFKHEQPQVLFMESHVTIGTIQQTQDAASVLWVYRHNSWHAAWSTVMLMFIFMGTRWNTLAWSPQKLN